jgi:ABC-type amino acid transport substrate-binding protein
MTTVGYGDKAPQTVGGRAIALIWMFAAIILISGFTAAITSTLTVGELESQIHGPEDLPGLRVTTVAGSTSEKYLNSQFIDCITYQSLDDAVYALVDGEADAAVYDAPILRYLAHTRYRGRMRVLPGVFERQDYGFVLPAGSELREPINQELLRVIGEPDWRRLLERYLGSES